jgi:excisionase family DNA binding protein
MQQTENSSTGQLMRDGDVARMIGITPRTVATWRAQGKIPYLKLGGAVRFRRESIVALLEGLERGGNQP